MVNQYIPAFPHLQSRGSTTELAKNLSGGGRGEEKRGRRRTYPSLGTGVVLGRAAPGGSEADDHHRSPWSSPGMQRPRAPGRS